MIPTFGGLRNMDLLLGKFSGIQKEEGRCVLESKQKNAQTSFVEDEEEVQVLCRSLKKKVQSFDISFEADFMQEHQNSLKQKLKNYIETSIKQAQQNKVQWSSCQLFSPYFVTESENQPSPLNISANALLTKQQQIQFSKDLQPQDKFPQFMQILSKYMLKEVSDELIYISFFIWELHIQIRKPLLSTNQISTAAANYVQKNLEQLFKDERLSFLTLSKAKQDWKKPVKEIKAAFQQFLKYYTETILLIIEGYFENPFYVQGGKRERDQQYLNLDSSEQSDIFPSTESQESWTSRQFPSKAKKLF